MFLCLALAGRIHVMAIRCVLKTAMAVGVLVAMALLIVACSSSDRSSEGSATDASRGDGSSADVGGPVEQATIAYDEKGILVPSKLRAIGVAIPRGFKRKAAETGRSIYIGPVQAEKVVSFYHKYLDCSFVVKLGRGWKFKNATPRRPGDPSRMANVLIIEESREVTRVILTDRSLRIGTKAPDGGAKTYDELHKAAHQGEGNIRTPIPGTY